MQCRYVYCLSVPCNRHFSSNARTPPSHTRSQLGILSAPTIPCAFLLLHMLQLSIYCWFSSKDSTAWQNSRFLYFCPQHYDLLIEAASWCFLIWNGSDETITPTELVLVFLNGVSWRRNIVLESKSNENIYNSLFKKKIRKSFHRVNHSKMA